MSEKKSPLHKIYKAASEQSKDITSGSIDILVSALESKDWRIIQNLRASMEKQLSGIPLPDIIRSTQEVTGGPENIKVNITILRPVGSENEVLPIMLYLHGGGFMIGGFYSHGKSAIDLSNAVRAVVIFIEYSLSPEAPFPVATEEIFAALCWVRENAAEINGDPEKIVVLGDSAGGNLAAVVSLMAKDRGLGDAIKAQVLLYPVTSPHQDFPSYKIYEDGYYILPAKSMILCNELYYPKPPVELNNPYATPLIAPLEQLSGLPPALLVTAECDVLRDEGEAYGNRLTEAGVDVTGIRALNTTHGFMTYLGPTTPQYTYTFKTIVNFISDNLDIK
ncbi:hypothetical protein K501DRAFT_338868 [Backusella circina FSU 941]|nr:hypothetical protein K501DRAFT_338868 [Backusella circina FSU 941]